MPGSLSKDISNDQDAAEKKRAMRMLYVTGFFQVLSSVVLVQATPGFVLRHHRGHGARSVQTLNRMTSAAAVLEFLLNPAFGALSDALGRKPCLMLAPIATIVCRGMVVLRPTLGPVVAGRLIMGALLQVFLSALKASASDVFGSNPQELASVAGNMQMLVRLAFVVGAALGGKLAAADARVPYGVAVAIGVITLGLISNTYKETLPKSDRKPFTFSATNPFRFLRLFQSGESMAKLSLVSALQQLPDNSGDFGLIYAKEIRNWGPEQNGRFMAVSAAAGAVASAFTGNLTRALGFKTFTTMANVTSATSNALLGRATTGLRAYTAVAVGAPGTVRGAAVNSIMTRVGTDLGMGQGQLAADQANLAAVIRAAGPLLFGWLYATGVKRKNKSLPYVTAALMLLAAECVSSTLPPSQFRRTAPKSE